MFTASRYVCERVALRSSTIVMAISSTSILLLFSFGEDMSFLIDALNLSVGFADLRSDIVITKNDLIKRWLNALDLTFDVPDRFA